MEVPISELTLECVDEFYYLRYDLWWRWHARRWLGFGVGGRRLRSLVSCCGLPDSVPSAYPPSPRECSHSDVRGK